MGEFNQVAGGLLGFLAGVARASQELQQRKSQERLALLQILGRDPTREVTVAGPEARQPTNPFQRLLGAGQFQPSGGSPVVELGGTPLVAQSFGTEGLSELAASLTPEEQQDPIIQARLRSGGNPQEIRLQVAQRREQLTQMKATRDLAERRVGTQERGLELREQEATARRAERQATRTQRQEERTQDRAERQATRELLAQNRELQQEQIRLRIEERKRKNAGILLPSEQRKTALDLRSNIRQEPAFKDFAGARQAFNIILGGAKRAQEATKVRTDAEGTTAATDTNQAANLADLALISGFARLLDPGSVVRPSEFATVQRSRAVIARLETLRARVERGEQLLPRERREFVRTARTIMREYIQITEKEIGPIYRGLAQSAKIPFSDVFVNPRNVLQGDDEDLGTDTPAVPEAAGNLDVGGTMTLPDGTVIRRKN